MQDTLKHKGMRKKLTKLVASKGITDPKVLDAINSVPRHLFMDSGFIDHAYQDKAFPISAGQTISQPYTVAFQTELLQLNPGDKVLEIGTGSGYQTAVLLHLKAKMYTVERQQSLFKKTQRFFEKMGYRPKRFVFGDGYKGLPEDAPYDAIVVTAGAPEIPKALMEQLKIGGRLVIPIGVRDQVMTRITRTSEKEFKKEGFGTFRFVPLLEDKT